jgi:hypothetical protein
MTVLANHEMKAGRYAKLAKGRKLFARMNDCWNAGGFVRIGTATRYSDLKAKHRDLVTIGKSGSLYVQHGKRRDCIDFCNFQFAE